jgi:hypothetical protein
MEPWYKLATPRAEVREGRSFHPDEFAIALEQVVRGTAPEDYSDPAKFFSRPCFTLGSWRPSNNAALTFSAWPMPFRRCILRTARKSVSWMLCYWRFRARE